MKSPSIKRKSYESSSISDRLNHSSYGDNNTKKVKRFDSFTKSADEIQILTEDTKEDILLIDDEQCEELKDEFEDFNNENGSKINSAERQKSFERKRDVKQEADVLSQKRKKCVYSGASRERSHDSLHNTAKFVRNTNRLCKRDATTEASKSGVSNLSVNRSLLVNAGNRMTSTRAVLDRRKIGNSYRSEVEDTVAISSRHSSECRLVSNLAMQDLLRKQEVAMEFFQVALSKFQSFIDDLSAMPEIFHKQNVALEFSQEALRKFQSVADDLRDLIRESTIEEFADCVDMEEERTSEIHEKQELKHNTQNTESELKSSPKEIVDVSDSDEECDTIGEFKEGLPDRSIDAGGPPAYQNHKMVSRSMPRIRSNI